MRKTVVTAFAAVLWCFLAAAQELREWKTPSGLSYGNEIGVRYGVQIGVGSSYGHPEQVAMHYVAVDYARYNYYNIGFRTGVNWFMNTIGSGQLISVPMQFTWRSGKLVSKDRSSDPQGYYYNGQFYPDKDFGNPTSILADALLPRLPSIVELHVGVTPGMLLGDLKRVSNGFKTNRRFTCSADIGGRLSLPIKRVRIFVDITYHYYLTRNFSVAWSGEKIGGSFIEIGGGVAYNF